MIHCLETFWRKDTLGQVEVDGGAGGMPNDVDVAYSPHKIVIKSSATLSSSESREIAIVVMQALWY